MSEFYDIQEELESLSSSEGASLLRGDFFWCGVDLWLSEEEAQ